MRNQEQANELHERLIDLGVSIIRLTARMPRTPAGRHVSVQLLRSGTSPAPNYGEARGAESRADFGHKLAIVLKELNETHTWLKMIERSQLTDASTVAPLLDEVDQLSRIVASSLRTVRINQRPPVANSPNNKSQMTNEQ